ncbi:MAG: hypothetical protein EOO38_21075 [Cytophagaceae bacterium]|nr:MAG: hypothetical protein EOO38_21075 [Cytophagaceae bacterium]
MKILLRAPSLNLTSTAVKNATLSPTCVVVNGTSYSWQPREVSLPNLGSNAIVKGLFESNCNRKGLLNKGIMSFPNKPCSETPFPADFVLFDSVLGALNTSDPHLDAHSDLLVCLKGVLGGREGIIRNSHDQTTGAPNAIGYEQAALLGLIVGFLVSVGWTAVQNLRNKKPQITALPGENDDVARIGLWDNAVELTAV